MRIGNCDIKKNDSNKCFFNTDISCVNTNAGGFMAPFSLCWVLLRMFAWYGAAYQLCSITLAQIYSKSEESRRLHVPSWAILERACSM